MSTDTKHLDDVKTCHEKFGILVGQGPGRLTQRKLKERVEFLLEELLELVQASGLDIDMDHDYNLTVNEAADTNDLAGQADALVDLVYVALGTGVMLGLPWQQLWDDVQRANMSKVRGVGKRGHAVDLIKPPGWVEPKTDVILAEAGYDPKTPERDDQ